MKDNKSEIYLGGGNNLVISTSKLITCYETLTLIVDNYIAHLVEKTKDFMFKNPNESEIEIFYINEILPYTKDSITELLS